MPLHEIADALINKAIDKVHNAAEYCNRKEQEYRQLRNDETIIMHMQYDNNKSVKFVKAMIQSVIKALLCPYTWVGATAAFMFMLPDGIPDPSYYQPFSLMLWCFSISLWLAMNILNVRGKPEAEKQNIIAE
jgi:hypothetical protein